MESIRLILGANLHDLRKERKMTQGQLASMIGYEVQSYHKWENGKAWPELETIIALARALNVPESRLFYDPSIFTPKMAVNVLNNLVDSLNKN